MVRRRWLVLTALAVVTVLTAGLTLSRLLGTPEPGDTPAARAWTTAPGYGIVTADAPGARQRWWLAGRGVSLPAASDEGDQERDSGALEARAAAVLDAILDPRTEGTSPAGAWARLSGAGEWGGVSVDHHDGLLVVDLPFDPWAPGDAPAGTPPGSVLTQQLVWTAQTVVATTDPVVLTHRGSPVRGVLAHPLSGPVEADPRRVAGAPPASPGRSLVVADSVVVPGDTVTLALSSRVGDVPLRGTQYELIRIAAGEGTEAVAGADTDAVAGADTVPTAYLTSDSGTGRASRMVGSATPTDDGRAVRRAAPDRVALPDDLPPGPWLLCVRGVGVPGLAQDADQRRLRTCAVLQVAATPLSYAGIEELPAASGGAAAGAAVRVEPADGGGERLRVALRTAGPPACLVVTDVRAADDTLVVVTRDPTPAGGRCPVDPADEDVYPLSEREGERLLPQMRSAVVLRPAQPASRLRLLRAEGGQQG